MDLGEALNYESDRILDPITNTTESLSSIQQLGWHARQYHRLLMQCIIDAKTPHYDRPLTQTPEDVQKPSTN